MEISIKKLQAADLPLARALIREWHRDEGEPDPVLPSDDHLRELLVRDDFHVYVALHGDRVIGGLTAYELIMFYREENELFLYEIGVSTAFRRKGVARQLIEALQRTCRERGINVIFVGTTPDNSAARRLYVNTGAKEESVAWFEYDLEKRTSK